MQRTTTGKEQFGKLVNSETKIQVNIVTEKQDRTGKKEGEFHFGHTDAKVGESTDENGKKDMKVTSAVISICASEAQAAHDTEAKYDKEGNQLTIDGIRVSPNLSTIDIMAVELGHEIEILPKRTMSVQMQKALHMKRSLLR